MTNYSAAEVELAANRYWFVTGFNFDSFAGWLGFNLRFEYPIIQPRVLSVAINTHAHRKMEMLLSPHWNALLRAHLIKHPQK